MNGADAKNTETQDAGPTTEATAKEAAKMAGRIASWPFFAAIITFALAIIRMDGTWAIASALFTLAVVAVIYVTAYMALHEFQHIK